MGVLDKFLDVMKLNDEEEFEDDEFMEDDDPYYEDEKPQKKSFFKRGNKSDDFADDYDDEPAPARKSGRVPARPALPDKSASRQAARRASEMEVCVMRPTAVEDSRTIAETLLGNRTVVLNLEGLDIDVAQRIIDFVSGATYALDGNLQKVSQYIFLLTPANVDISGDLNGLFGEGSAASESGQY